MGDCQTGARRRGTQASQAQDGTPAFGCLSTPGPRGYHHRVRGRKGRGARYAGRAVRGVSPRRRRTHGQLPTTQRSKELNDKTSLPVLIAGDADQAGTRGVGAAIEALIDVGIRAAMWLPR